MATVSRSFFSCYNCRNLLLRTFIRERRTIIRPLQRRRYHNQDPLHPEEPPVKDALSVLENQPSTQKPWYLDDSLRDDMPEFSLRPRRQELPSLPPHPPPILSPLLEQLSAQYGIDDISLLDLRTLDPPSALGDNLIMLIGTARSEKHVHAVADRLCRWLRSEPYKLSPSADGLIGQNELKIRLKRRAKRMRIRAMSAAATPEAELDDGTTTSWVCVNLGEVDGGVLPKQREQRMFVGFGSSHAGSNLVVQIFTVEKRAQVDLEKLWMGILERAREGGEADENGEGF